MHQDFEKAYKELAEIEVPDLWDRIEAGLNQKSAPVTESIMTDESAERAENAIINGNPKHAENAVMNGNPKRAENAIINGNPKHAENAVMKGNPKRAENAVMKGNPKHAENAVMNGNPKRAENTIIDENVNCTENVVMDESTNHAQNSITEEAKEEIPEAPANVKKKFRFAAFAKRYSALAAVVLCVCLVIPAVIAMRQMKGDIAYSGSADSAGSAAEAFDTAASEACEQEYLLAETEESAQAETSGEASAEDWAESMPDGLEGVEEKGYDAGEGETAASAEESSLADFSDEVKREDVFGESNPREAEKQASDINNVQSESAAASLTEGMVLENVTVKVMEIEDHFHEQELEETGTLYTAIVQEDVSGTLTEGQEIVIFIPVYSSFALSKDDTFTLSLAFCDKEDYSFILYYG